MNECHFGDCRDVLRQMIADGVRVNMVATSPPYWGLRDYGTATWEGGDDPGCDHLEVRSSTRGGPHSTITGGQDTTAHVGAFRDRCGKCGARRIDSQLGLEPTLAEYVANMVEVFGLVREVLSDDGVLFCNLGDSYAGGGGFSPNSPSNVNGSIQSGSRGSIPGGIPVGNGLKPKDLCGVPWRVAFALQEAGWWLRQDIIWSKKNSMPESVQDRCCKSHEYVFLMAKSARYFFDSEAIKERAVGGTPGNVTHKGKTAYEAGDEFMRTKVGLTEIGAVETRLKRSVWEISSQSFSDAHFATFPEKLVEPMILAGTSAHGHCPKCGKGWVRVVEREFQKTQNVDNSHRYDQDTTHGWKAKGIANTQTLGWQPSCDHNLTPVPGVVLDPFLGSGTVAKVAQSLGRNWLGIELNKAYGEFQDNRITQYGLALS